MTKLQRPLLLGSAMSVAILTSLAAAPALADSAGDVQVTNAETVQVYLSPDGKIDSQRVYEQLQLTGKGSVDLRNPISTDNLRNLDGFSGFDVQDGQQVVKQDVDGQEALRSVSDYDGDLPLRVSVEYKLDGKTVEPGDVVGADGRLEVLYTVENVTGAPQQVSFDDGHGQTVTRTVDVPIPMVAQLVTTAPPSFDNITSKSANMGGDGHGGTQLNFTMTLFPPIGSTKATVGYAADIRDGVVPRAEITGLPVNPMESPVFQAAATGFQTGANSGVALTGGSTKIDTNLLRLRDGAGKLVDGLIQLDDGAARLRDGLADEAAPGAARLADGTDRLDQGLGKLSAGAGRLRDGTGAALDGSRQLRDGLGRISDGLGRLADTRSGLPAATKGIRQLQDGIDQIIAGMGDRTDPQTLIGGLSALHDGLGRARLGSSFLTAGVGLLVDPQTGLPAAKAGVDLIKSKLADAGPQADALVAALQGAKATAGCQSDPVCVGTLEKVIPQVQNTKAQLQLAAGGLQQVSDGLNTAIQGINNQLKPGMEQLTSGLSDAETGSTKLLMGAESVNDGLGQVRNGLGQLAEGVEKAVAGVMQLDDGAVQAYDGSSRLADGMGRLDAGAGKLAAGAGEAKAGSAKIADGAGQLSDGLRTAADGSGKLSDGLGQARSGAPKLVDGAQRLSDEGTKKLVAGGEDAAQSYGEMVAVLKAGADRATNDDMAFGAPDGATGFTAYSYVLEGASGEGQRNLMRGAAGGALLAAAAGVLAIRRRLV